MKEIPESNLRVEQAEKLFQSIVQKEIDEYAEREGGILINDPRANILESLKQCLLDGVQRSAALLIVYHEAHVSHEKARGLGLDKAKIEEIQAEWQFQVLKNISAHFVGLWMKEKGLTNMP